MGNQHCPLLCCASYGQVHHEKGGDNKTLVFVVEIEESRLAFTFHVSGSDLYGAHTHFTYLSLRMVILSLLRSVISDGIGASYKIRRIRFIVREIDAYNKGLPLVTAVTSDIAPRAQYQYRVWTTEDKDKCCHAQEGTGTSTVIRGPPSLD